ncbi:hypothetical protein J2793_006990 [Paraburkholderia caledonica]|uniref:Uncharacterized protein n=1 Tax=Paraburkholderia caledonica TaxID=134536 RepID=A0AB73INL0_9BURK|nr:hypothetical protein [Paraburkholderia caledonica]
MFNFRFAIKVYTCDARADIPRPAIVHSANPWTVLQSSRRLQRHWRISSEREQEVVQPVSVWQAIDRHSQFVHVGKVGQAANPAEM